MILDDWQEAALAVAAEAHARFTIGEAQERAIALRQAEERIKSLRAERDRAFAAASEAGVPVSRLATSALGTTNRAEVKRIIERGKELPQPAPAAVQVDEPREVERYQLHGNQLIVTLQPEDFEGVLEGVAGEQVHAFTVYDDGTILPEDAEDDDTWLHPVVRVVMTETGKKEIHEWLATR